MRKLEGIILLKIILSVLMWFKYGCSKYKLNSLNVLNSADYKIIKEVSNYSVFHDMN